MPRLLFDEQLSETLCKFVWIRLGNCTTEEIAALIRRRRDDIVEFDAQSDVSVLELG